MPEYPEPMLDELQQREPTMAAVPVRQDGPVTTHELPARAGTVFDFALTPEWQMVLPADPKRKRVLLVSATDWEVSHSGGSAGRGGAYWPAKVPLEWRNTSAIYASVLTGTGLLSVIPEEWAD
jgi:hypothetical protein